MKVRETRRKKKEQGAAYNSFNSEFRKDISIRTELLRMEGRVLAEISVGQLF
jgi:hypothetical protein